MNEKSNASEALPTSAQDLEKYFRSAQYIQSAPKLAQCPAVAGTEIAFAGRSNAGKSSAINTLVSNKKLAKTSKTPGRTQLINFFELADGNRLVDLPGYGYAKVSRTKKIQWQKHLLAYLEHREVLSGLVLVMDARHPLQPFDEMMLEWVGQYQMPSVIVLTKCDKLSKNEAKKSEFRVIKRTKNFANCSTIPFSSHDGFGVDACRKAIAALLQQSPQ